MNEPDRAAVFAQTNDAHANALVAFTRDADGALANAGAYPTGGRGTGTPHLPSQGSVAVDASGQHVLLVNAGSDELSYFCVADEPRLIATIPSGGERPISIAVHREQAYVLHAASGTIVGFALGRSITPRHGTLRTLPDGADPAQIGVTPDGTALVVTDRATSSLLVYRLDRYDYEVYPSSGTTPYGFDFVGETLVVTEAFGGAVGEAAASSYALDGAAVRPLSASVGNARSEVCWAVAAADRRHAWVTNFGDGTISLYDVAPDGTLSLAEPVAASTVAGRKGVRDAARSSDGRFLYALDADARRVFGFRVEADARLVPVGSADGLPGTVAGLAAI
jgi:6-phosphogluconolactonase